MKNGLFVFICSIFFVSAGYPQNSKLTIEATNGKFFLKHTVVAKENWYSIGRLFNCSPHDIASYNNLSFDKPLDVAQQINIPLSINNFDQKQIKVAGESLIPIYHVVQDKEWMFRISSIYNDVPVTSIEKWNKIKRDNVKQGMPLIVGFLKVKTDLSPLATGVLSNPVGTPPPVESVSKLTKPIASPDPTTVKTNSVATVANGPANAGPTTIPVSTASSSDQVNNYSITHSNGGFFSVDYTGSGKTAAGQSGTFKSTSGWTDGKYYALMNGIPVGTIIRVSGSNGKIIYVKVLGQLPEMKESSGLLIRISNAASAELGLGEGKFPVDIKY